MRGDDRCSDRRRGREIGGIGEAADVVAEHGPGLASRPKHDRPPRVDRQRRLEACSERLDGGDHPVELLGLGHLGSRPRLHATHVEHVGALGDKLLGATEERVERERLAGVEKRVRRPVEDAHDKGAVGDLVDAVTESKAHRLGGYGVAPTRASLLPGARRPR